jgi:hypothetical protein
MLQFQIPQREIKPRIVPCHKGTLINCSGTPRRRKSPPRTAQPSTRDSSNRFTVFDEKTMRSISLSRLVEADSARKEAASISMSRFGFRWKDSARIQYLHETPKPLHLHSLLFVFLSKS